MIMTSLNLADMVVTFLALLGPQKVLLSFARVAQTLDATSLRLVAVATAVGAACIGVVCALTAPWLATFFHISTPALELAAGLVFFVYALGLVFGIHFDLDRRRPEHGAVPRRGRPPTAAGDGRPGAPAQQRVPHHAAALRGQPARGRRRRCEESLLGQRLGRPLDGGGRVRARRPHGRGCAR